MTPRATRSYPLDRPVRLSLDSFATRAGLHPELIRRWVALGLLEPTRDADGGLWFAPVQLRTVARIQRLRTGLSVNYAALGLVMDLLDRIDLLEQALHSTGVRPPRNALSPSVPARHAK
ncbi:MAG TPA: chaperone modulator CbpM [Pseudonocardiaceae bacterium]|nr:chaperone modulator CbpM [Pseudonocardiaceae bacterium]